MKNNEAKVNNMFLLGAGFTRALTPNAPLNADLLRILIEDNPESLLRRYQTRYHSDDIENILTRLDLEICELQSERLREDRIAINAEIAKYFKKFRFGEIEESIGSETWLKSFAEDVFSQNDAIITLNYDCLIEGLLDFYGVWSPSTGYAEIKVDVPGTVFANYPNPKNILIYKIHGSENFHTCSVPESNVDPSHIGLVVNGEIYPKSGKCSHLGVANGESYIIAPSFVKAFYPQIKIIILSALQAAGQAKNLVIIGCGLRPEDSHLRLLLTNFLNRPADNRKLLIVDPNANKIADEIAVSAPQSVKIKRFPKGLEKAVDDLAKELH